MLGRPTVREAELPQRAQDDPRSECRCAERRQDPEASQPLLLAAASGALAGYGTGVPARKGAHVGRVSRWRHGDNDAGTKGQVGRLSCGGGERT